MIHRLQTLIAQLHSVEGELDALVNEAKAMEARAASLGGALADLDQAELQLAAKRDELVGLETRHDELLKQFDALRKRFL